MIDIELVETCGACPHQFDAFLNGKQVGYLRLRHGYFQVRYPESYGKLIYEAYPRGDGVFAPDERDYYLNEAKKAITAELIKELHERY